MKHVFRTRFCLLQLTLLAGVLVFFPCSASAQWQETTIDGNKYVSLSEIGRVVGMKPMGKRKESREYGISGDVHALIVKTDSREVLIDGVRHWFSFPVIKGKSGGPYVSLADVNNTLVPAISPPSVKKMGKVNSVKTVVFDPGHGGHENGGKSPYGYEKDYTLDVVNRTRKILEKKGVKCVQSRLGDSHVSLSSRPAMCSNYKDPIFVSVHFNFADWKPSANGIEVFAMPPQGCPITGGKVDPIRDRVSNPGNAYEPASFVLANTIHNTLLAKTGGFDRGVKRSRFAVLRVSTVPAVLVECAFLTNPEEAKKIASPTWRQMFSEKLAEGIMAYIDFANKDKLPPRAVDMGRKPTDEFVHEE